MGAADSKGERREMNCRYCNKVIESEEFHAGDYVSTVAIVVRPGCVHPIMLFHLDCFEKIKNSNYFASVPADFPGVKNG